MRILSYFLLVSALLVIAQSCEDQVDPKESEFSKQNINDVSWLIAEGVKDCGVALHARWEILENGDLDATDVECENEINRAKDWDNTETFKTKVGAARWVAEQTEQYGGCSESRQEKVDGGWKVCARACP